MGLDWPCAAGAAHGAVTRCNADFGERVLHQSQVMRKRPPPTPACPTCCTHPACPTCCTHPACPAAPHPACPALPCPACALCPMPCAYALCPVPMPMPYALCPVPMPCAYAHAHALCPMPMPYALCPVPMPYALCPVPVPYALCPVPVYLPALPDALPCSSCLCRPGGYGTRPITHLNVCRRLPGRVRAARRESLSR